MIKKILTFVITAMLICSSFAVTAFADSTYIGATSNSGKAGKQVTVDVYISGNAGFDSYGIDLQYDHSVLELVGLSAGGLSVAGFIGNPASDMTGFSHYETISGDGTLFKATFNIKSGATEGYYYVTPVVNYIGIAGGAMMSPGVGGGGITVLHECKNNLSDVAEVPATCTSEGTAAHKVCSCGLLYINGDYENPVSASSLVIPKKAHTIQKNGVKAATCTAAGYTGDDYCTTCKQTINKGTAIAKKAHRYGDVVGAKAATCTEQGYSGDKTCLDCNYTLKGSATPLAAHKTELVNVKEATCKAEGYTGDQKCTVCKNTIVKGNVIAKTSHKAKTVNAKAATCTAEGYTGDQRCEYCNTEMSKGTSIPKTAHTPTTVGHRDSTCTVNGYSGDTVCSQCNTKLETGHSLELAAHTEMVVNAVASTCLVQGYSGDVVCAACGAAIRAGAATPLGDHQWVWRTDKPATVEETGLRHQECIECGAKQNENTVIDKLPENHVHTFGEWKSDKDYHWKECECGEISEKAPHNKSIANAKDASETEIGYSGDTVCKDCKFEIEKGKDLPVLEKIEDNTVPMANNAGNGVNLWLIIGIIVGVCAVFFLFFIIFKRRKKDEEEENQQGQA